MLVELDDQQSRENIMTARPDTLRDLVVVIAGASSGFGRGAAEKLADMMPDITERMSANIAKKEAEKGSPTPENQGAIHAPMQDGLGIDGGIASA